MKSLLDRVNDPSDLRKLDFHQLGILAGDIRSFMIRHVTRTGGHLSPNLGVVELTIALHRVFRMPQDSIIWDVGHQSYVHKILSGRKKDFTRLRQKGGLCGFPLPEESRYDVIHAGHSSTSLSIAAGIARGKILRGEYTDTVAVIGDGAFTAGIVYEALNHIAHERLPVIVVLNDNGMSISPNVGGIAKIFKKLELSRSYLHFKLSMEKILRSKIPVIGVKIVGLLYRLKGALKSFLMPRNFFEDMGISYYGPVDGHDLKKLVQAFQEIKGIDKPILVHAITVKGKGYKPSEENPGKYHGISGLSVNGDSSIPVVSKNPSYSELFGETLVRIARRDKKVFAVTAAMPTGTGLKTFAEKFPDRFADVGIAEQHAVDFALGLALKGFKPVVAVYSTFLQRGFDQLVHDIGIAKAGVLFCLDRAGLVPGDGATHQGIFDIAYLRMIPNFSILMPSSKTEFELMLETVLKELPKRGPVAIRYPKDEALDGGDLRSARRPIRWGEGYTAAEGRDAVIVSTGTLLDEAFQARRKLIRWGVRAEIYNLRFAKPINNTVIARLAAGKRPVLLLEEGVDSGGIGAYLTDAIRTVHPTKTIGRITLPDEFPCVADRRQLLDAYGLTADAIEHKILRMLKKHK